MKLLKKSRRFITAITLLLIVTITSACASAPSAEQTAQLPPAGYGQIYSQIERGSTSQGQQFGDWIVSKRTRAN